ncbi:MAG: hypothetical protein ACI4IM_00960 [Acutalibacteraceae bacterium]
MGSNIPIRTRAVGGFDKQQVDRYLDELSAECENAAAKEDIAELRREIDELKDTLRQKEEYEKTLRQKIKSFDEESKSEIDNISYSAKKFTDAHNEVLKITDETSRYINAAERKLPSLLKGLTEVSNSADSLKSELSELSKQIDSIPVSDKSGTKDEDIFEL